MSGACRKGHHAKHSLLAISQLLVLAFYEELLLGVVAQYLVDTVQFGNNKSGCNQQEKGGKHEEMNAGKYQACMKDQLAVSSPPLTRSLTSKKRMQGPLPQYYDLNLCKWMISITGWKLLAMQY